MSEIRVTAVVPTYQRASLVGRCLESVLGQSRPPDQVIVVDDGSTDSTLEELRAFGDRIELVSQVNSGASSARNHGVARTTSPWIAFCDSDDWWLPDHLERLEAAMLATGQRAALYFDDTVIADSDGGGTFFGVAGLSIEGHRLVGAPVPWVHARLQPMLLQSSIIRRSVFEDLGGLRTDLGTRHDTHLFYRIGFLYPMCAVAGLGVHLCDDAGEGDRLTGHGGQRSRRFWAESLLMHDDLATLAPDASTRRLLERQIAGDRVRLAVHDLRDGRVRGAVGHGWRATSGSPVTVARLIGRGLRRRVLRQAPDVARIPR